MANPHDGISRMFVVAAEHVKAFLDNLPEVYEGMRPELERLIDHMNAVREGLDRIPREKAPRKKAAGGYATVYPSSTDPR